MMEEVVRMVLLPRYTAVYGASALYSAPFNVRRFAKVVLTGWAGRGVGTSAPDVVITLEQSADVGLWHAAGNVTPAAETEESATIDLLDLEWARVKVEIVPATGQPPGTTAWAVGSFVPREGVEA